ncbi:MAG: hypothetical protein AAF449_05165, partial [Myxococcota bacterium]
TINCDSTQASGADTWQCTLGGVWRSSPGGLLLTDFNTGTGALETPICAPNCPASRRSAPCARALSPTSPSPR